MSSLTTIILPPLCFREFDNSANPLAGGLVYSYAAGSTTPVVTYTDATGATPNTNPVVLNYRGEASVWLLAGQAYKFVVTDANGNLIRTVDDVNQAPSSGSFTVGTVGLTTVQTGTVYWTQNGNVVTASLGNAISGTSNDVVFQLTGIPTALQPPSVVVTFALGSAKDNSAAVSTASLEVLAAESTWVLSLAGASAGWTDSGTKSVGAFAITYLLI